MRALYHTIRGGELERLIVEAAVEHGVEVRRRLDEKPAHVYYLSDMPTLTYFTKLSGLTGIPLGSFKFSKGHETGYELSDVTFEACKCWIDMTLEGIISYDERIS